MKTYKQIKEEIANVSAGIGVRGFGDVSGTPKIGDEEQQNPHIDRVIQGANENNELVKQYVQNNTDGVYTWEGGFDWWADRKGIAKYTKTKSSEPLGLTPLTPKIAKEFGISLNEEGEGGMTTTAGPGMGDNPEVFPGKTKHNKKAFLMPLIRRLPLKFNEEIANVTGAAVATDKPVVNRAAQENWKKENNAFTRLMLKRKKSK